MLDSTGEVLVGMIIAHCPQSNQSFAIPAGSIFADVIEKHQLQVTSLDQLLTLPTPDSEFRSLIFGPESLERPAVRVDQPTAFFGHASSGGKGQRERNYGDTSRTWSTATGSSATYNAEDEYHKSGSGYSPPRTASTAPTTVSYDNFHAKPTPAGERYPSSVYSDSRAELIDSSFSHASALYNDVFAVAGRTFDTKRLHGSWETFEGLLQQSTRGGKGPESYFHANCQNCW